MNQITIGCCTLIHGDNATCVVPEPIDTITSMSRDNAYLIGNKFAVGAKPNSTAFKPGVTPWNKGLHYMPSGCEKGWFKKGQRGNRALPVGTINIRVHRGVSRRWIKTKETGPHRGRWIVYASWLWKKSHGPIPLGMMVHHLDGNSMNDCLSNYGLVTRSLHLKLHHAKLIQAKTRKRRELT